MRLGSSISRDASRAPRARTALRPRSKGGEGDTRGRAGDRDITDAPRVVAEVVANRSDDTEATAHTGRWGPGARFESRGVSARRAGLWRAGRTGAGGHLPATARRGVTGASNERWVARTDGVRTSARPGRHDDSAEQRWFPARRAVQAPSRRENAQERRRQDSVERRAV
jgi:hypothetical protein